MPPFKETVLIPAEDADRALHGAWQVVADPTAASGYRVWHPNAGAPKLAEPLANPANYFEMRFLADPSQEYNFWIRLKAEDDNWANDSVFAQFTGVQDAAGNPIYQIGTTSGLAVNLEECSNCGVSGWGWEDDGWGAVNKNGTTLRFPQGGPQTIRIQTRETVCRSIRSCCRRRNTKRRALGRQERHREAESRGPVFRAAGNSYTGRRSTARQPLAPVRFSRPSVPPCASAICRLSARPMPDPVGLVVKNGTNRLVVSGSPGLRPRRSAADSRPAAPVDPHLAAVFIVASTALRTMLISSCSS